MDYRSLLYSLPAKVHTIFENWGFYAKYSTQGFASDPKNFCVFLRFLRAEHTLSARNKNRCLSFFQKATMVVRLRIINKNFCEKTIINVSRARAYLHRRRKKFRLRTKSKSSADEIFFNCGRNPAPTVLHTPTQPPIDKNLPNFIINRSFPYFFS